MTAPLRIAVIGAGAMGSRHARVVAQSAGAELVVVVDSDGAVGREVAERFGVAWLPDDQSLLGSGSGVGGVGPIDAVVVAAATEAHHAIGRRVLERGLPLLMEKPLADRLADVQDLVDLADERDIPLVCGLLERFNPALMTALAVVEEPRHVTAVRHSPYVARVRTGVATDLLVHDVDLALRISRSELSSVRGSFGCFRAGSPGGSEAGSAAVEDVAEALLGFADGMVANLSASRMSQRKVREFVVAETARLIEVDMLRNAVTIYRHVLNESPSDGLSYRQQTIIEIPALVSSREPLAAQLDHFIELASGRGDAAAERASILPAHRVIDQIRHNAEAIGDL